MSGMDLIMTAESDPSIRDQLAADMSTFYEDLQKECQQTKEESKKWQETSWSFSYIRQTRGNIRKKELLSIIDSISNAGCDVKILPKETRCKRLLYEWLDKHWTVVYPYLSHQNMQQPELEMIEVITSDQFRY